MRKSFKKGMAMLLAAAMVFSTPVAVNKTAVKAAAAPTVVTESSTTEDAVDCLTGFFTGFSNYYKATGNFEATFNMTLQGAVKGKDDKGNDVYQNWYAPLLVIASDVDRAAPEAAAEAGYFEYAVRRADQYGWGLAEKSTTMKKDWFTADAENGIDKPVDWPAWVNAMVTEGTKYSINIKRVSNKLTVTYGMEAGGKKYNMIEEIQYDMPSTIRMFLSGENNKYTINSYTYKEAEGIADGLLGDASAELSENGKSINLKYSTKMSIPADDLSIKVNGKVVATGSAVSAEAVSGAATYVYTPEEDGEYTFTVAANEQTVGGEKYQAQEKTATITVAKDGDRFYVKDDTLFTDFGVSKTTTDKVFKVDWNAATGVTATVKVTDKDGKQVGDTLSAPGNVTVSAEGEYTADIVATKGNSIKKGSAKFTYKAAATPDPAKKDKFSNITTKPLYKYTFDDAKEVTLSSKATVKDGVLNLAPSAGKHGEYYAKIDSMTADDFSKGITFIADINPTTEGDWTPIVVFGDGTPAKKDAAGTTYRWAITEGFSSKAGTSAGGFHDGSGFYGGTISAPYTYDYFNTAANRNKWYTIAVTVKKNEMIMYINGVQVQKGTDRDCIDIINGMKKSNNNYLGASYWDADPDFAGSMDDVAIYNTALSAADVKKLNRSAQGGDINPPKPPVNNAKVSKVSIKVPNRKAGKTIYVKKGDKVTLKATVTGTGNYSKSVTWKSSKTKVATVKNGKVTAKKAGTAKITATSKTDKTKKATITIKVSKKAVKNKKLKISPTKKSLKKGKSLTIKIKKMTKKTTDKITYKSSKKSVATVDAYGKVKAKKKGKATITVKCGKKKAKLKLTVKK